MTPDFTALPTQAEEEGCFHVVIETPKGSRNKFAFEPAHGVFLLKGVLPEGSSFPYDFGFVPGTRGEDGDPLDVLVLMDAPAFPGCVIEARLLGAIEAEQTEADGTVQRNDRLVAVLASSRQHQHLRELADLPKQLLDEVEHFFKSYNQLHGRRFKPLARSGAGQAAELIATGQKAFRAARRKPKKS